MIDYFLEKVSLLVKYKTDVCNKAKKWGTNCQANECELPDSCGECGFVVLRLSKGLKPEKYQLFFDKFSCQHKT